MPPRRLRPCNVRERGPLARSWTALAGLCGMAPTGAVSDLRAGAFGFLVLSVFDDFSVRVTTLRTLECAPVVIGFVWLDATKPQRCAAVRALRQVESQSRWIKNSGCGHGRLHANYRNII
jgi:hypothetical protein